MKQYLLLVCAWLLLSLPVWAQGLRTVTRVSGITRPAPLVGGGITPAGFEASTLVRWQVRRTHAAVGLGLGYRSYGRGGAGGWHLPLEAGYYAGPQQRMYVYGGPWVHVPTQGQHTRGVMTGVEFRIPLSRQVVLQPGVEGRWQVGTPERTVPTARRELSFSLSLGLGQRQAARRSRPQ
ncbi:MAG: hypothetical protein SF053_13575 [Bacteroidia bacterium]|nr:hypothetical protein [Bacteroidia bacterium]